MGSRKSANFWRSIRRRRALKQRLPMIRALDADVDRQLTAAGEASAAISNRASILVATAGLISGLQVSSASPLPSLFAIAAAIVGILLLIMRTADEVPISEAETRFWNTDQNRALRDLMRWKLDILTEREQASTRRRRLLVVGFVLLVVSIVCDLGPDIVHLIAVGG